MKLRNLEKKMADYFSKQMIFDKENWTKDKFNVFVRLKKNQICPSVRESCHSDIVSLDSLLALAIK